MKPQKDPRCHPRGSALLPRSREPERASLPPADAAPFGFGAVGGENEVGQGVLPDGPPQKGSKGEKGQDIRIGDQEPVEVPIELPGLRDPSSRPQKPLLLGEEELHPGGNKGGQSLAHHLPFVMDIDDDPRHAGLHEKVHGPGDGRTPPHRDERLGNVRKERTEPGSQTRGKDESAESHGESGGSGNRR